MAACCCPPSSWTSIRSNSPAAPSATCSPILHRFVGATLADPNEGREYGRGKAQVMQRADGTLWIHSFAHGRTTYDLKYDADRLREVLATVPDDEVIATVRAPHSAYGRDRRHDQDPHPP